MNTIQQAIEGLLSAADKLETLLTLITDETQREAEAATALAEIRAGKIPSIILKAVNP
jgi:hypothetical protein